MNAPDKCPFCSALMDGPDGKWVLYTCGTHISEHVDQRRNQSPACIKTERDQLRAQVEQWKAYAERLEANQCEPEPSAWTTVESFTHPSFDGPFHDVPTSIYTVPLYRKAKETKP
jgi:hypothetical protein